MSSEAAPISSAAFAEALEALPLSALHLKAAEIRNSLAHLEYSNAQLEPFARPPAGSAEQPDQVCIDAIEENLGVMAQMRERLRLLREEAERRGVGWGELLGRDDIDQGEPEVADTAVSPETERHMTTSEERDLGIVEAENARYRRGSTEPLEEPRPPTLPEWLDGTFRSGRIIGGRVVYDNTSTGERVIFDNTSTGGRARIVDNTTSGAAVRAFAHTSSGERVMVYDNTNSVQSSTISGESSNAGAAITPPANGGATHGGGANRGASNGHGGATNGGATNGSATNGGATIGGPTNGHAANGGTTNGSSAQGEVLSEEEVRRRVQQSIDENDGMYL